MEVPHKIPIEAKSIRHLKLLSVSHYNICHGLIKVPNVSEYNQEIDSQLTKLLRGYDRKIKHAMFKGGFEEEHSEVIEVTYRDNIVAHWWWNTGVFSDRLIRTNYPKRFKEWVGRESSGPDYTGLDNLFYLDKRLTPEYQAMVLKLSKNPRIQGMARRFVKKLELRGIDLESFFNNLIKKGLISIYQ